MGFTIPSVAHLPIDWILIAALVALLTFDAMRSGPSRAIALSLAAPLAAFFIGLLQEAAFLGPVSLQFSKTPTQQTLLFAALFVVLLVLIYRLISSFGGSVNLIRALMVGLAGTAVVLSVWMHVPALQSLWHFNSTIQAAFGAAYAMWWLLAALAVLAFSRS